MRRRLAAVLALCVALSLLSGGPARAATSFTFYGSGWGHGIGMSQYGAYGLAQRGWGPAEIIRHYYRNSTVDQQPPPLKRFRIGLLQYRQVVDLVAAKGPFTLRLTNGTRVGRVRAGKSVRVIVKNGRYRIRRPNGRLVGGHAWGSSSVHLRAIRAKGSVIRVPQWGHALGRGFLELRIVSSGSAHLAGVIPPEPYLFGIGEVPSLWPEGVLAAQAIAARTYAYRIVANLKADPAARSSKMARCACHLLGTPADQNYTGWDKEVETGGARWVSAVRATARQVALYGGNPITTYYSSSSGGHTENIEHVWIGAAPQPYLKGVCDPAEDETGNPNEFWSTSRSGSAVARAVGRGVGSTVRRVVPVAWGVSGRVTRVKVVGSAKTVYLTGWEMRGALGLRDTRFSVNKNFNIRGVIRNRYDRLNCAPGRAKGPNRKLNGGRMQTFANGRLYYHRGRNVVTWIRAAILTKYRAKRGHAGFLKLPYRWRSINGGKGRRAWFDGGEILWKRSEAEAFEIHGPVLEKYRAEGAFRSLGYPLTDVQAPDELTLTSAFQNGTITCSRSDPASPWECTRTT